MLRRGGARQRVGTGAWNSLPPVAVTAFHLSLQVGAEVTREVDPMLRTTEMVSSGV
ncbi:MAG: hypothetical protein JWN48_1946 [Myxococcaceae bacterium]|nr:hypothetical protein [Myxococcaceae bacterium]